MGVVRNGVSIVREYVCLVVAIRRTVHSVPPVPPFTLFTSNGKHNSRPFATFLENNWPTLNGISYCFVSYCKINSRPNALIMEPSKKFSTHWAEYLRRFLFQYFYVW